MPHTFVRRAALALAAGTLLTAAAPATASDDGAMPRPADRMALAAARAHTAAFHDVGLAVAAGCAQDPVTDLQQLACIDQPGVGAMGEHHVNGLHFGKPLDGRTPQALTYGPQPDGTQRLVGVEYLVFASDRHAANPDTVPTRFGQRFHRVPEGHRYGLPAFHALHVWLWRHNPAGLFADRNPAVRCP